MAEIKLTLIVARSIDQELEAYKRHENQAYREKLAVAYLSKADMERLGVKSGGTVKVSSPQGSTIVRAVEDPDLEEGLIVMLKGYWASRLTSPNPSREGLLVDRGIEVTVESIEGEVQPPSFPKP
ncbi:MAG: hypothetical protein DRO52_02115 [Candidatus Hecatellales archaeon]|nr:MAG: hypothetical protein DRO52_02115 [Candidatus Hecatellales archaeon]